MNIEMTEDRLVQKTVADYMEQQLSWESVFAYNTEVLGENGTLGRSSEHEVVLVRYLRQSLEKLNKGLPVAAYESAIKQITESSVIKSTLQMNREKYDLYRNGVLVSYRNNNGHIEKKRLKVFDFENPTENYFMVVRELWIRQVPYRRRPDIIGFVNGIPLLFVELKNVHRDIQHAYDDNLADYKDTIPRLLDHNAIIVLSNGDESKVGSLSAKYGHFHQWKRLREEDAGVVDMETMLKGMCTKANFMDIFENFILFDESSGKLVKILSRNHQFLGVNRAIEAVKVREKRNGKLGVFWHTQGAGKSYSMAFFSQKVHRKLPGNYSFLVVTDREDLDTQIYKTFAGCGLVDNDKDPCRAGSGNHLPELLKADKPYVFTMIFKFNKDVDPDEPYSPRDDVIVISDEAHRTQYGRLALNMRNALPHASYIGFTGTPLFKDDEITRRIFGNYVSTYDFQRAVDDKATVRLYYDNRGEKLKLTTTKINDKIAAKIEELELENDPDKRARLEAEMSREYHIITADKRLEAIAKDFVQHYTTSWESGKAMLVCIDKITTVRMYNLIQQEWKKRIQTAEKDIIKAQDEQEEVYLQRQLNWLKETEMAVVISEEQGEIDQFRKWDLDIVPHRAKIKDGYETDDGKRIDIDLAFKDPEHPFRIAVVCAMWLTGFDVPSLATLYLDKPLKAHTLMQAIARANRVYEGKNNGLVVDYCGILKNLRKALATFATGSDDGEGEDADSGDDPVKPADEDLLEELDEAIEMTRLFLKEKGFRLEDVIEREGFDRIAAIRLAKEIINENDNTRKKYEILAREVFKKFKACITIQPQINEYKLPYAAIDIIYKKLQDDKKKADITDIIRQLHAIVNEAIEPDLEITPEDKDKIYDISKIDFDRLRQEFARSPSKNTTVQSLKQVVEKRLDTMLKRNPLRADYYKRYQQIIEEYNREKDRVTIEETFAALLKFVEELDDEDKRAIREGLTEEYLAVFDLLVQDKELSSQARGKIKKIAMELLEALKTEKLRVDHWQEKDATKAEVKSFILDFLYDESNGLPADSYTEEEVQKKAVVVFDHIFRQYPDAEHHIYAA